jgi:diketogulonate reductase-like aldo/keto reductase
MGPFGPPPRSPRPLGRIGSGRARLKSGFGGRFVVDVLVDIAGARNVSAAQVALAWTLGRPAAASVIIGGRNEAQLRDNLGAANLQLTADERERLDKVSAPPLLYPYWHQVQTASERVSPGSPSAPTNRIKCRARVQNAGADNGRMREP